MKKLDSLKTLLVSAVRARADDPARLALYVDSGRIAARGTRSLSFEYRYKAVIDVFGFAAVLDTLLAPVLAWIAEHQPDLIERALQEPFTFAEILDDTSADVTIKIERTEAVRVTRQGADLRVEHLPEPSRADAFADVPAGTPLSRGIAMNLALSGLVLAPDR